MLTLTVLPHISYWGFRAPITPATTGPTLIPIRVIKLLYEFSLMLLMEARKARAYSMSVVMWRRVE